MKYYELHETFWEGLANKGYFSWDKEDIEDILHNSRNFHIEEFSKGYFQGFEPISFLDMGCGSGSQGFYFATKGVDCHGIEISSKQSNWEKFYLIS